MRAAVYLVWVLAALAVVWPWLRSRSSAPPERLGVPRDELVKDPVCQTYVVRSRAVHRVLGGESRYFCSRDCASRYSTS
jgi:YHS domain-containing protein